MWYRRLRVLPVLSWALVCSAHGMAPAAQTRPAAANASSGQPLRLPDAILGRSYSASLPLASSVGRVESKTERGSLPDGLVLSGSWIKGLPKKTGWFEITVLASDELGQEARGQFAIEVLKPPAPPLAVVSRAIPDVTACIPYEYHLICAGGYPPYVWRIASGELPKGLRLDNDGRIVGQVMEAIRKAYSVRLTVSVTDSLQHSASEELTLFVRPNEWNALRLDSQSSRQADSLSFPSAVYGRAYEVFVPIRGGQGRIRWDVTGPLPDGIEFREGMLRGTPRRSGEWKFALTAADEIHQKLTVSCVLEVLPPHAGPAKIRTETLPPALLGDPWTAGLDVAGGLPPYTWTVRNLPPWAKHEGGQIRGTPSAVTDLGTQQIEVSLQDASGGQDGPRSLSLKVAPNPRFPPPKLSIGRLPTGIVGQHYETLIPISGGCPPFAVTIAEAALPPGLSCTASGLVSGTPDRAGDWEIPVTVRDSLGQGGTSSQKETLAFRIVEPPPPALQIVTRMLPEAMLGEAYHASLRALGGWPPYTWRLSGDLPRWAKLEPDAIVGLPSDVSLLGSAELALMVQDSRGHQAGPAKLSLKVTTNPSFGAPEVLTKRFPTATIGDDYAASVAVAGGRPPYAVKIVEQKLPDGLAISEGGQLTGRISKSGNWHVTLLAIDSLGQKSEAREISLTTREIASDSLRLGTTSRLTGVVHRKLDFQIPVSGGVLPYTYALTGELADGLRLDQQTGRVSGIPIRAGEYLLRVVVTDEAPQTNQVQGQVALTILPGGSSWWVAWGGWLCASLAVVCLIIAYSRLRRRVEPPDDTPDG